MKTNLNTLAKNITLQEGKKLNLSIAQVKEVMRILIEELKALTFAEVIELLRRK